MTFFFANSAIKRAGAVCIATLMLGSGAGATVFSIDEFYIEKGPTSAWRTEIFRDSFDDGFFAAVGAGWQCDLYRERRRLPGGRPDGYRAFADGFRPRAAELHRSEPVRPNPARRLHGSRGSGRAGRGLKLGRSRTPRPGYVTANQRGSRPPAGGLRQFEQHERPSAGAVRQKWARYARRRRLYRPCPSSKFLGQLIV